VAREYPGEIALLVTDVIMPEMNGRQLSAALRKDFPNIKTLYMSGYTADVIVSSGVLDEGIYFLEKPFSKRALAAKVRETLSAVKKEP
jgi:FixJ family two-component response regulator